MIDSASLPADRHAARAADASSAPAAPMELPRRPVLGWSSFGRDRVMAAPSIDAMANRAFTTSGRAAIFHALHQLALGPGSVVLVPTYHCPTMVAPVLCAGMQPRFFGIDEDGLPDLASIDLAALPRPSAMIAAQYFGLPRSLAAVRAWCDSHGIALIEDCAHSYFGMAGERPVGHWGDLATASASKFLPLPEAGVLASSNRTLAPLRLESPSMAAQVKGLVDVVELGTQYRRFPGMNGALASLFRWKNGNKAAPRPDNTVDPTPDAEAMMRGCDMGRIAESPLWVSLQLANRLPRDRVVRQRRANFARLLQHFVNVPGARPLSDQLPDGAAPYVLPLWVDDADRVYHALRGIAAPVFRWDHIWPGTPLLAGDQGPLWSRHVLQLLCHQDMTVTDIDRVADAVLQLLGHARPADRPHRLAP